jgi:hypothetical protein
MDDLGDLTSEVIKENPKQERVTRYFDYFKKACSYFEKISPTITTIAEKIGSLISSIF